MLHCSSNVPALGTILSHSQREAGDQDDLLGTEEGRGTRAASSPSPEGFTAQQQPTLSSISWISSLGWLSPLQYKRAGGQALGLFHVKEQVQQSYLPGRVPCAAPCGARGVGAHVLPVALPCYPKN